MGDLKKKLVKLLIKRRISHNSKIFIKKISRVNAGNSFKVNPEIATVHKEKWAKIFNGEIDLTWLTWYKKNSGISSPDFIPENVFYTTVEATVNNPRFEVSYSDKNFYDPTNSKGIFPENIIRNIDGLYFDDDFKPLAVGSHEQLNKILAGNDSGFVKPALESGGGRAVELFRSKNGIFQSADGKELTLKVLETNYKVNFIFQKPLSQHPFVKQFNSTSLNTLRVLTYRSSTTNQINILQVVFRVGAKGQYVDNFRAGGFSIGVNKDGLINKFAFNRDGIRIEKVNDINLKESVLQIPLFENVQSTAKLIAEKTFITVCWRST